MMSGKGRFAAPLIALTILGAPRQVSVTGQAGG
jgi:hypothetical protein